LLHDRPIAPNNARRVPAPDPEADQQRVSTIPVIVRQRGAANRGGTCAASAVKAIHDAPSRKQRQIEDADNISGVVRLVAPWGSTSRDREEDEGQSHHQRVQLQLRSGGESPARQPWRVEENSRVIATSSRRSTPAQPRPGERRGERHHA